MEAKGWTIVVPRLPLSYSSEWGLDRALGALEAAETVAVVVILDELAATGVVPTQPLSRVTPRRSLRAQGCERSAGQAVPLCPAND